MVYIPSSIYTLRCNRIPTNIRYAIGMSKGVSFNKNKVLFGMNWSIFKGDKEIIASRYVGDMIENSYLIGEDDTILRLKIEIDQ